MQRGKQIEDQHKKGNYLYVIMWVLRNLYMRIVNAILTVDADARKNSVQLIVLISFWIGFDF